MNTTSKNIHENREKKALQFANKHNLIVVLKGHQTLIATPDGSLFTNTTGRVNLATAGTGDVLAGMIGSLLAQGHSTLHASQIGVFLHGLAGDLWYEKHGDRGMIASDLIQYLLEAQNQLL